MLFCLDLLANLLHKKALWVYEFAKRISQASLLAFFIGVTRFELATSTSLTGRTLKKPAHTFNFLLWIHPYTHGYVRFTLSMPISCTFPNFCWNFVDPHQKSLKILNFDEVLMTLDKYYNYIKQYIIFMLLKQESRKYLLLKISPVLSCCMG